MPLELLCAWVHKHLRQVQLPLADSATWLGFSSQSAVAHWFRCRFACSVSQWRRGGHTPEPLADADQLAIPSKASLNAHQIN
jgi:AraC-like DNA-binding protein